MHYNMKDHKELNHSSLLWDQQKPINEDQVLPAE